MDPYFLCYCCLYSDALKHQKYDDNNCHNANDQVYDSNSLAVTLSTSVPSPSFQHIHHHKQEISQNHFNLENNISDNPDMSTSYSSVSTKSSPNNDNRLIFRRPRSKSTSLLFNSDSDPLRTHQRHVQKYHSPTRRSPPSPPSSSLSPSPVDSTNIILSHARAENAFSTPDESLEQRSVAPSMNIPVEKFPVTARATDSLTNHETNKYFNDSNEFSNIIKQADNISNQDVLMFSGDEYSVFPEHNYDTKSELDSNYCNNTDDFCEDSPIDFKNSLTLDNPLSCLTKHTYPKLISVPINGRKRCASISGSKCQIGCKETNEETRLAISSYIEKSNSFNRHQYLVHHGTCSKHVDMIDHSTLPVDFKILRYEDLSIPKEIYRPVRTYIFGYGSLINPQSRLRTMPGPTIAIPVIVKNLHRSWSYNCTCRSYTAVGVRRYKGALCNGVLVPISNPSSELPRLDLREKDYVRKRICPGDILLLNSFKHFIDEDEDAIVWVYELDHNKPNVSSTTECVVGSDFRVPLSKIPMTESISQSKSSLTDSIKNSIAVSTAYSSDDSSVEFSPDSEKKPSVRKHKIGNNIVYIESGEHVPTLQVPIPQTYVDCILAGCFKYGPSFAEAFVKTTCGWDGVWVNDRHVHDRVKRYVRCTEVGETWTHEEEQLDAVLEKCLGEVFRRRLPWNAVAHETPQLGKATIACLDK